MNKKKNFILLIITISLFSTSLFSVMGVSKEQLTYKQDSFFIPTIDEYPNVKITLDIEGKTIGQELLWKANTTGTNYEESAVTYLDGTAYVGSCSTHGDGHDKLFAINTANGEILWSKATGPGYVGPVIDDDVIYMGTSTHCHEPGNEFMYAVNRFTGDEIWKRQIYGGIPESVQFDEEKIYFCADCGANKIYALNKNDGSINWTFQTPLEACPIKPMLKDNALYASYFDSPTVGELYKINASTGKLIYKIELPGGPWDNSITADNKGRIFIAIYSSYSINAYNETDGSLLWSTPLHAGSLSFNAYHNGMVYIADTMGYLYALNSTNGSIVWEKKLGNKFDISSPTISGGIIFIGTRDWENSAFFAINETTGEILWKYNLEGSVTAPPTIANGMMLCGTDEWYTYAFNFGQGDGDWPLHRYDSYNTAYSPRGLTTWQYVEATCTPIQEGTMCTITNQYNHEVLNIKLENPYNAYWYNSEKNMLKTLSNNYTLDRLQEMSSIDIIISKEPLPPIPKINITKPENALYIGDRKIMPTNIPLILGKITIETQITYQYDDIDRVEFYINNKLKEVKRNTPYFFTWDERAFLNNNIKTVVVTEDELRGSDEISIWIFNWGI